VFVCVEKCTFAELKSKEGVHDYHYLSLYQTVFKSNPTIFYSNQYSI
jgi:hypothetical protein